MRAYKIDETHTIDPRASDSSICHNAASQRHYLIEIGQSVLKIHAPMKAHM